MAHTSTGLDALARLSADLRRQMAPETYVQRRWPRCRAWRETTAAARLLEVSSPNQTCLLSMLLNHKDRMGMATGREKGIMRGQ
jgi:hypothetical protein